MILRLPFIIFIVYSAGVRTGVIHCSGGITGVDGTQENLSKPVRVSFLSPLHLLRQRSAYSLFDFGKFFAGVFTSLAQSISKSSPLAPRAYIMKSPGIGGPKYIIRLVISPTTNKQEIDAESIRRNMLPISSTEDAVAGCVSVVAGFVE